MGDWNSMMTWRSMKAKAEAMAEAEWRKKSTKNLALELTRLAMQTSIEAAERSTGRWFHYAPSCEQEVVALFGRYHDLLGFEAILKVRKKYPDCVAIRCGKLLGVEFEYRSSNFVVHRHGEGADVVVCWTKDMDLSDFEVEVIELQTRLDAYRKPAPMECPPFRPGTRPRESAEIKRLLED